MKILTNNDGWVVYQRIFSLITKAKMTYEFHYSSGSTIHSYGNIASIAQTALSLLGSKLEQKVSLEELQVYSDKAYRLAYDLTLWVGKQSA